MSSVDAVSAAATEAQSNVQQQAEQVSPVEPSNQATGAVEESQEENKEPASFTILVKTLHGDTLPLQVSLMDTVQDVRQYLFETAEASDLTSYILQLDGKSINDFAELSELEDLKPEATLDMVPAPYNKRSALLHIRRLREILSFHLFNASNSPSPSLFSHFGLPEDEELIEAPKPKEKSKDSSNKNKVVVKSEKEELASLSAGLNNFYPKTTETVPHCVKSIEFAGWNPPPGNRSLLGDLYYLQITTLEGQTIFVTSWTYGFYVNSSTEKVFNPRPASKAYHSHNLSDLLSQVSPSFKKSLQQVLRSGQFGRHPFELMAVPVPLTPWVGKAAPHVFDKNRSEYSILYTEIDFSGNMRDWNEEYQACKELPANTIQERIIRDRAIVKVHNDFVESATRGAIAIVGQSVAPINPHEDPRMHLFVYNNIFFSYCFDHREPDFTPAQPPKGKEDEKDKYGEQATYVSANNDLKGIRAYNDVDVPGLSTVLTTIVDYRGFRLLAQSLIPGVMQREETHLSYGSMDSGKTIHSDPQFHERMLKAARNLHMKEQEVTDASGNQVKICCPINAKGIVGTDGRQYLIDLGRATPVDANYLATEKEKNQESWIHPSSEPLLRPELVSVFCEALEVRLMHQKDKEVSVVLNEGGEEKVIKIDLTSSILTVETEKEEETVAKEEQKQEVAPAGQETSTEPEKEKEKTMIITINPNVFNDNPNFKVTASKEEIEKDETLVKTLALFLRDSIIPKMAEEFVHFLSAPVDGQTLSSILHRNGINLRYLGLIANLCKSRPFLTRLLEQEMITRAAKYEFNRYLREVEEHLVGLAATHFLNCLFGETKELTQYPDLFTLENEEHLEVSKSTTENGTSQPTKSKKKKSKPASVPEVTFSSVPTAKVFKLSSASLWSSIQQSVKKRFQYEINLKGGGGISKQAADDINLNSRQRTRSLPALRSFAQKVGIQLAARNYEFTQGAPFQRKDILDIFPLIKHLQLKSKDGAQLLQAGKMFFAEGRLDVAFELFNEALAIYHQVVGPMHPETALCYGNLAMVHYHANDTAQAISYQKKMVIINERVLGLDHHDTAHAYGNLALFTRDLKKDHLIPSALQCIKRAHYLASLVSGPHYPDAPNTLTHIATMYQDLGNLQLALKFYMDALQSNQYFYGAEDNMQTGQICHGIAIAYSLQDNFKEALNWEKRNYTILSKLVGEKDFRTNEANIWLKQFTRKAVQMQIEAKKAQRDITSQLSQEKLAALKQQLPRDGKAAAAAAASVSGTASASGATAKSRLGAAGVAAARGGLRGRAGAGRKAAFNISSSTATRH